jgi:hypothetical protein
MEPVREWLRRNVDDDTADNMMRLARRIPNTDVCTHTPDRTLVGVRYDGDYIGWSHGRTK